MGGFTESQPPTFSPTYHIGHPDFDPPPGGAQSERSALQITVDSDTTPNCEHLYVHSEGTLAIDK